MRKMPDYVEIVRNEEIREVEILLELAQEIEDLRLDRQV